MVHGRRGEQRRNADAFGTDHAVGQDDDVVDLTAADMRTAASAWMQIASSAGRMPAAPLARDR